MADKEEVDEALLVSKFRIPDGRDYPDITIRYEPIPLTDGEYALTIFTDRVPGELQIRIVDGHGNDHTVKGWDKEVL